MPKTKSKDCDPQGIVRVQRILAGAAAALAVFCAPAAAQTIRLWPATTVDGPHILVADVATLAGFSQDQLTSLKAVAIEPAPRPGADRTLAIDDVKSALVGAGVNLARVCFKGASQCLVHRPFAIPEPDPAKDGSTRAQPPVDPTLGRAIRRWVESRLEGYEGRVELRFGQTSAALLALSSPAFRFEIAPRGDSSLGKIELRVTILRGDAPPQTEDISVVATLVSRVCVAGRNLNRGQAIREQDLLYQERRFTKLNELGIDDPHHAVGQQMRRFVPAGAVLRRADIQAVPLVKRNELVRVVSSSGAIFLESSAKALEKGTLGDIIEVRNEASRKAFRARVTGLRQVEVFDGTGEGAS